MLRGCSVEDTSSKSNVHAVTDERVLLYNHNRHRPPGKRIKKQVPKDKKVMDDIYYKP